MFFLLLLSSPSFSQLVGRVVSVADGDTFTMLVQKKHIKIRLHGIDCPEKAQDFGANARKFLSDFVFDKVVTVEKRGRDKYGRTIGMVVVDGINVNESLLVAGLAWHYVQYDQNPLWDEMEAKARHGKKGLWSQANPIAPWHYRKSKSGKNKL